MPTCTHYPEKIPLHLQARYPCTADAGALPLSLPALSSACLHLGSATAPVFKKLPTRLHFVVPYYRVIAVKHTCGAVTPTRHGRA